MAGLATVFGSGAMTNSIADIQESRCIFVTGSDTSSQHPLLATRIAQAKDRGARLIVADPRAIHLTVLADLYLPLRPGTNVVLANAMAKVILDRGLEDTEFIAQRVEGFEEFREALKGVSLQEAEAITGVPAQDIERAAVEYAQTKPASIIYAMGITQHTTGTDNVLSLANLALLTGNIGRPGAGVNPLRGQNNVQGACDMGALPNFLPGYRAVADAGNREKAEAVWGVRLPPTPGLTVTEMADAALAGDLRAMYIMGENPLVSDADVGHTRESLERLEFLVVQDIFLTETAQLAHVVLPSCSWAEKEGTFTNTERRVQLLRAAIGPCGEAKPDWQIICELAEAMGAPSLFSFKSPEEIFEELRRLTPQYAGMNYRRLRQGGLQWPCPAEEHPGTPILHTREFTRGKGKLTPLSYKAPAEVPDEEYPLTLTTGRVMSQYHTGTMTRRSPCLEEEFPRPFVEMNIEDANARGIRHGALVEVSSRRGTVTAEARLSQRVRRGVVFMPFHYAEGAANVLTNRALDPVAKIPELKVCAVKVTPAG